MLPPPLQPARPLSYAAAGWAVSGCAIGMYAVRGAGAAGAGVVIGAEGAAAGAAHIG